MKKIILTTGGILIALAVVGGTIVYWTQLRGIWPAITKPEQDIVRLIEQASTSVSQPEEQATPTTTTATPKPPKQTAPVISQGPLRIPQGFSLSIFAKDLNDPRVLTTDPSNVLLASIPGKGNVVALIDTNNDGKSDETKIVVSGLNAPHGILVQCAQENICKLYVAETDKVSEFTYDAAALTATNKRVIASLPSGGGHSTRTLLPYKNNLLVSIGSSCNVCNENDPNRATIAKIDIGTGKTETFARGLRNAVFMAFNPLTGDIWATEMGRDLLGDNTPPDEINIIKQGGNYGWPICYGKNSHDTEFDKNTYFRNPCMEPFETPSYIDIQAHSAPLGLAFIPNSWPEEYHNDLLVAYHGSWNRSVPTGYKIVRHQFNANGTYEGVTDFITGWIDGEQKTLGRPVDILFHANGAAYISDDKAGVIYRLAPITNKQ
ncbi:MAG: L-sorbosone dehydrogenase [uncultured bacterium]|uniref:L-sorbosone dehydrogenase n=2 Tax=Candidatus Wolfeibacteriota TaxID=1752735 RepID=A0A0G1HBD8_9BACT|nr:MAG: L-sorbosone dehydrogenase [uncultured bacterium]KKR12918.1 MAG: L-sorbosone dehydrogenase [Candidatus Wolfebacteria bacterium GW2011_GWC2_39_22]KKT43848.1 MAG: L-sorbosone dehydrogenase [Candidatus Wolfebacteria bacterium GW2011_GWE2_44_13]HBI25426.1 hypothetical protein [Candidatus Wolfebacteria bacterium]